MLQWNELRVTPDGKYLIIDVEVLKQSYYENIHIETLALRAFKNSSEYSPISPKGTVIYIWRDSEVVPLEGETYLEVGESGKHYKRIRKVLDLELIKDNLFFVTATNNSDFAEDTPCGVKAVSLLGVVYDKNLLYNNSINALKELDDCTPSRNLIEFILNLKAFTLALELGDYTTAIDYWNNKFKDTSNKYKPNCGCYGN